LTKNVVSYHSSVVKVLAIWRARGPCPLQYPSSGFLQTKIPMLSFCIGTVRLQNFCLVSLTWDGYSVVNGSVWGTRSVSNVLASGDYMLFTEFVNGYQTFKP